MIASPRPLRAAFAGVEEDLRRCVSEGKALIVEGSHLDLVRRRATSPVFLHSLLHFLSGTPALTDVPPARALT